MTNSKLLKIILASLFLIKLVYSQDTAEIDRLEKLINTGTKAAEDYILPTDARQYQATDNNVQGKCSFQIGSTKNCYSANTW